MAFGGGRKGVKNDINVTPLVDVVLVLLIIFMVVTPMLQRGKDVSLPAAGKLEEDKGSDPLMLSITSDKKTYIETNEAAAEALESGVHDALKKEPGKRIMLKGDDKLTVGDVRPILTRIRNAGASSVQLAVQEKQ
jgi:biopolymer transport protein TolR